MPDNAAWQRLREASSHLGREDLSALPALDDAYRQFEGRRDQAGQLLAAAFAVQVIAAAYADFREAGAWVARLREAGGALPLLRKDEQLVVCGAVVSAAVIAGTASFDSPAIASAVTCALELLDENAGDDAADHAVAAARSLLEYGEQQAQPEIFHRVVRAVEHCSSATAANAPGPLIIGRYLIYKARCRFRLGAYELDKRDDTEAIALLDRAEALGAKARLPQLQFDARYARVLLAAIRHDMASLSGLVERMHEVLDYARPNCVALYYQHLCRVYLMHARVAAAFEASEHALRAARLAACAPGEVRSYRVMHALALLASGEAGRSAAEIESMLPDVSGRPRAILECTLRFVTAWGARGDANYRERLHRAMQHAQELNWPLFLNSLPRISAQLAADALRAGIAEELARRAIRLRALVPPSDADDHWPWPIRIYTLGRLALFIDDEPLSFTGKAQRKPLGLLKLALVAGSRGIDSERAGAELWPDLDGDASRNAFDVALHRLRKLLRHDGALTLAHGRLLLDAKSVWVDAWMFESACDEAENVAAEGKVDMLAPRLLRLYAGPFLADDEARSVLSMRERLRSRLLRSLSILGQRLEQRHDYDEAILLYRCAIEVDSLAEEFHRRLMLCYRAQGRIAEALGAYRRCRDVISITLGVSPSAATQAVYRSLKQS